MKFLISAVIMYSIKIFTSIFYKVELKWLSGSPSETWDNEKLKAIIFFNHTSLYEMIFIAAIPYHFLWKFCQRMVAPGADKTLNRPLVGKFWKIMIPQIITISRRRDHTWAKFKSMIDGDSIVTIAAEGRMKRPNGLDVFGKRMTVKGGNIDIINMIDSGKMIFAYSGGLHHVQAPGQTIPKLFKRIKLNIEVVDIVEFKAKFENRKQMLAELQKRLETNCPES
jgi:hypothetical protein